MKNLSRTKRFLPLYNANFLWKNYPFHKNVPNYYIRRVIIYNDATDYQGTYLCYNKRIYVQEKT